MAKKRSNSTASASSVGSARSKASSKKEEDDNEHEEVEEAEEENENSEAEEDNDDDDNDNDEDNQEDDPDEVDETKNETSTTSTKSARPKAPPGILVEKIPINNKTLKQTLVGGPLLGSRSRTFETDVLSWQQFEPVVSPCMMALSRRGKVFTQQRMILLPHTQYISVLAYKTGMPIGTLIPLSEQEEERQQQENNQSPAKRAAKHVKVAIECVSIVTIPKRNKNQLKKSVQDVLAEMNEDENNEDADMEEVEENATTQEEEEVVALVGCNDGTIREFLLHTLLSSKSSLSSSAMAAVDCGPYHVAGPCYRPRRVFQVTNGKQPILKLACPAPSSMLASETMFEQQDGLLVYALSETKSLEAAKHDKSKVKKQKRKMKKEVKKNADTDEEEEPETMEVADEEGNQGPNKADDTRPSSKQADTKKRSSLGKPNSPTVQVALLRLVLPPPPPPSTEKKTTNKKSTNEGTSFISLLTARSDDKQGNFDDDDVDKKNIVDMSSSRIQVVDQISCMVGKGKKGDRFNTIPFSLQAIARPARSTATVNESTTNQCVFVMVARSTDLHIYYEPLAGPSSSSSSLGEASATAAKRCNSVVLSSSLRDPVSTALISSNKSDIACGHMSGTIFVMNNMLSIIEDYQLAMANYERHFGGASGSTVAKGRMPDHPSKTVVSSRMHWHAHPVSALAYDAASSGMSVDPMLFSGGDESVLVTWQLSRNTNRPADVLPRIALGGIIHVAAVGGNTDESGAGGSMPNAILVHCEDNSLQLFESHNKARLWKVQGLAAQDRSEGAESSSMMGACMEADPRSSAATGSNQHPELVLLGLPDAPGYMHWYDPQLQQVTGSLEVSPYNRISRQQQDESPMPVPAIVNHSFSASGNDLITVDEVMTENTFVGAFIKGQNGPDYGVVTTIRFWTGNDSSTATDGGSSSRSTPYHEVASMTFPHGPKNRISAMAISPDGTLACTVSTDERAFRVWQKEGGAVFVKPENDDDDDEAQRRQEKHTVPRPPTAPSWSCRYKVTTPCGFSNMVTHRDAVAFSNDSSILAIGYGNFVTLWDTRETRLLTSVRHLESGGTGSDYEDAPTTAIDSIQFINTNRSHDLLLTQSQAGIALQSPFGVLAGSCLPRWSWGIPTRFQKGLVVSSACFMPNHDSFAVSMYSTLKDKSSVVWIDAETGDLGLKLDSDTTSNPTSCMDDIPGRLVSIRSLGQRRVISKWLSSGDRAKTNPVRLYGLTSRGTLLSFTERATGGSRGGSNNDTFARAMVPNLLYNDEWSDEEEGAPRLHVGRNKRARTEPSIPLGTISGVLVPKLAVNIFGGSSRDEGGASSVAPPTFDLPALSGAFVRAFVGRNLARQGN
jgi:hypothetical protein